MKILFILQYFPYPPTSGGLSRTFNLIKEIGSRHEITLLSFYHPEEPIEPEYIEEMKKYCTKVVLAPLIEGLGKEEKRPSVPHMIWRLIFKKLWFIDAYQSPKAKQIYEQLAKQHYDLVHIDLVQVAHLYKYFKDYPKVLNEQNVEAQIIKRRSGLAPNLKKRIISYFEYMKLNRFERKHLPIFDHVTAVSELDAQYFKRLFPGLPVTVVPNGVDLEYFKPSSTERKSRCAVYTGLMNWQPNEDAVLYFAKDIWPLVKAKVENADFTIVGQRPTSKVLELQSDATIRVTGFVEDIRPYVWQSLVYVVPLRYGGGTRLKILEAMAMGAAIVSTSIGCEGLEVEDGVNILIRDDPREFADAIVDLIGDRDKRESLGRAGRALVETSYGWAQIAKKLEQAYEETIAKSSKGTKLNS